MESSQKSVGLQGKAQEETSPHSIRTSLRSTKEWGPSSFDPQSFARKACSPNAPRTSHSYVRRRSFSNPDLKITKKNVDRELSAFIELVSHLQLSLQSKQQQGKTDGAKDTYLPAGQDILMQLKTIAESFVHTTPDHLRARNTILQIQRLHLTSVSAAPLEKELMIKLLFIISTYSRLEQYQESLKSSEDLEIEESEDSDSSGTNSPAIFGMDRDPSPRNNERVKMSLKNVKRLSRSLDDVSFNALLNEINKEKMESPPPVDMPAASEPIPVPKGPKHGQTEAHPPSKLRMVAKEGGKVATDERTPEKKKWEGKKPPKKRTVKRGSSKDLFKIKDKDKDKDKEKEKEKEKEREKEKQKEKEKEKDSKKKTKDKKRPKGRGKKREGDSGEFVIASPDLEEERAKGKGRGKERKHSKDKDLESTGTSNKKPLSSKSKIKLKSGDKIKDHKTEQEDGSSSSSGKVTPAQGGSPSSLETASPALPDKQPHLDKHDKDGTEEKSKLDKEGDGVGATHHHHHHHRDHGETVHEHKPPVPALQLDAVKHQHQAVLDDRSASSGGEESYTLMSSPDGSSGLERVESYDMSNLMFCRICEQEIPLEEMGDHMSICSKLTEPQIQLARADKRLRQLAKRAAQCVANAKDSQSTPPPFLPMIELAQSVAKEVAALPATQDDGARKCGKLVLQLRLAINKLQEQERAPTSDSPNCSPRENPMTIAKAIERQIHVKLDAYEKAAEIENESPRSHIRRTRSEIPTVADFSFIKPIAKGGYSRVYLARKKRTGDLYAIKVLKKSFIMVKNAEPHILAEKKILEMETHSPFIVKMYYSFHTRHHLFLVMEFLPGGDCYSLLKNQGRFDEPMAKMYIAETVLALEHLHDDGIVHRDLKPDNMLISAAGHIKLTDFGLSRIGLNRKVKGSNFAALEDEYFKDLEEEAKPSENPDSIPGTPDYLAPEVLLGLPHGKPVDWWALGCITYEFLMGAPPFCGSSVEEIFQRILSRDIIWPEELPSEYMSVEAKDFIDKLLKIDPTERLGFRGSQEVKDHPFFADVNWKSVLKRKQKAIFLPKPEHEEDLIYFEARNEDYQLSDSDEDNALIHQNNVNDQSKEDQPDEELKRSWDELEDPSRLARNLDRSPSPTDDAFGGFDSVVLKNLHHKTDRALKQMVRQNSSELGRLERNTSMPLRGAQPSGPRIHRAMSAYELGRSISETPGERMLTSRKAPSPLGTSSTTSPRVSRDARRGSPLSIPTVGGNRARANSEAVGASGSGYSREDASRSAKTEQKNGTTPAKD